MAEDMDGSYDYWLRRAERLRNHLAFAEKQADAWAKKIRERNAEVEAEEGPRLKPKGWTPPPWPRGARG